MLVKRVGKLAKEGVELCKRVALCAASAKESSGQCARGALLRKKGKKLYGGSEKD
jgi:hypothetical protein